MVRARVLIAFLFGPVVAGAQPRPLTGILPTDATPSVFVVSSDAKRSYYMKGAELWMLERDRPAARIAASGVSTSAELAISSLGDAIAFTKSGERYGSRRIWIIPLDPKTGLAAGEARKIGDGDGASFSPDGKRLALARDDATGVGQSVVVVTLATGAEKVVAPAQPNSVANIRWTPDGKTLYFGVNPPVPCVPDWSCLFLSGVERRPPATIHRVPADGGAVTLIATVRSPFPGLSPDGRSLVFADTGDVGYVIADPNGQRVGRLPLAGGQSVIGWAADASLLLRESGTPRRVKLVNVADGQVRELLQSSERVTLPTWAPDGNQFSLVARGPSGMRIDVVDDAGVTKKTVRIPDVAVTSTVWSPDGRYIAYTGSRESETARVRLVEVSTGTVSELLDLRGAATSVIQWLADSRSAIVSEIHGTGATRGSTIQHVTLSGAATVLRSLVLGPTPSMAMIVDPTTIVLTRAASPDMRALALRGDSVERVILGNLTGTTSSPMRGGDWVAFRRSTTTNDAFNAIEILRLDGTQRRSVALPFYLAPAPMNPIILPGGAKIVVTEGLPVSDGRDPMVSVVDVATAAVRNLFSYSVRSQMGPVYPELSLSPDGARLLAAYWEPLAPRVLTLDISPFRNRR